MIYMSQYGSPSPPPPWDNPSPGGPSWGGPSSSRPSSSGPDYPPPGGLRRLRRSTTDRQLAGVAGGLAEYLGVSSTAVRIAFVVLSLVALAGLGGPLLYLVAWAVVPEDNKGGPYKGQVAPGRPWRQWEQWDRSARSWAIVLGAIALACLWSFGFWPWWHWGTVPFWALVVIGLLIWAINRQHRSGRPLFADEPLARAGEVSGHAGRAAPPTGTPTGAAGPAPDDGPGAGPADPGPDGGPGAGPAGPGQPGSGTGGGGHPGLEADWSNPFLFHAHLGAGPPGVEEGTGLATGLGTAGTSTLQARPHPGRALRLLFTASTAVVAALVLAAVIAVVSITLSSGSSLKGGVGNRDVVPSSLQTVQNHYRLGVGNLDVDLSDLRFPPKGRTITMTVGVGQLTVVVPTGTDVTVDANVGIGNANVLGQKGSSVRVISPAAGHGNGRTPRLDLVAHVGLGNIEVSQPSSS